MEISEEEETRSVEIEKTLEEEKEITTTQLEVSLTVRRYAAFQRFVFSLKKLSSKKLQSMKWKKVPL